MIDVEVKGLIETQQKAEQVIADLHGGKVLAAMRDSVLLVERYAKQNTPVDTGRLRASITPVVRAEGDEIQGVVGSNVEYAGYVEYGTRPHWPPISAVQVWADRHGLDAFLVARAISRKGTKAHLYLTKAMETAEPAIKKKFDDAVKMAVD